MVLHFTSQALRYLENKQNYQSSIAISVDAQNVCEGEIQIFNRIMGILLDRGLSIHCFSLDTIQYKIKMVLHNTWRWFDLKVRKSV